MALESEAVVISAFLIKQDCIDTVSDFLKPEHFYSHVHGLIYETMLSLRSASKPIDTATVGGILHEDRLFMEQGGVGYLIEILNSSPAMELEHIYEHGRIIVDKWRLRRMLVELQKIEAEICVNTADNSSAILDEIERRVHEIVESDDVRDRFTGIDQAVQEHISKMEAIQRGDISPGGVSTGFVGIDRLTGGIRPGEFTILAALPARGKSGLSAQLAANIARSKHGAILFSLEMPTDQIIARLASGLSKIDLHRLRSAQLMSSEWDRYKAAAVELSSIPLTIYDKSYISMSEIRSRVRRRQSDLERSGQHLSIVIIDYLQLLKPGLTTNRSRNREQEVSEIARECKSMSMDLKVAVWGLSQLNRDVDKSETRRKPRMSDLRESGGLEANADNVFLLHREDESVDEDPIWETKLIVAKHRSGPIGTVDLTFERACVRFDG